MGENNGQAVHRLPVDQFGEFAAHIQRVAEQHLNACMEYMDNQDFGDESMECPAKAPFDGCNTCIVREVLMVTLDEVVEFVKQHPDEFAG